MRPWKCTNASWQHHQLHDREVPCCDSLSHQGGAAAGDDAFDLALDTEELLRNPVLGPLAAGTLERFAPGLDPREALFPVTRGPFGLPSPVPIPKLERLYFK